jgi:hypothetical protein
MPRTKAEPAYERPNTFPAFTQEELTPEERKEFRRIVALPFFKKVIRNIHSAKPSPIVGISRPGTDPLLIQIMAVERVNQLIGWELFECAFFQQLEVPVRKSQKQLQESFRTE